MNHADVQKRMADYLEGDLPIEKRAVFDAHLDGCEECRGEVEELRAIPNLLRRLPDVEPPAMLASDVMRRIRQGEARTTWLDRIQAFFGELSSPGIAIPTGAMLAAFLLAATSGKFSIEGLLNYGGAAQPIVARQLAPIPPEAAALASRVFRLEESAPGVLVSDTSGSPVRSHTSFQLQPVATGVQGGAGQRRVVIVSKPGLASSFAEPGQQSPRSADDWLSVVLEQPAEFARRQASLSLAEREHWVRVLARRAAETDTTEQVVEALRRRGGPQAMRFARAFAAEARLATSQIATSR